MKTKTLRDWSADHKLVMVEFLMTLSKSTLGGIIAFKGGTALYFFYGLDRFSVDLDFDCVAEKSPKEVRSAILEMIKKSFPKWKVIDDSDDRFQSARLYCDYGGTRKLKIEISWPVCQSKYELKALLGSKILVMRADSMFANKLIATYSRFEKREVLANRDLFDLDFFFKNKFGINDSVILCRTARMKIGSMDTVAYVQFLRSFLIERQAAIRKEIMQGLWELIDTQSKRDHVKNHLYNDVLRYLELYLVSHDFPLSEMEK